MVLHLPTNILITNLALSDLGVGVLVMPFTATSFVQLREYNVSGTFLVLYRDAFDDQFVGLRQSL